MNTAKEMCSEALLTQFHQNVSLHRDSLTLKNSRRLIKLIERESDPIHYYILHTYMECNGTRVR